MACGSLPAPLVQDFHNSCTTNLHESLAAIGWKLTDYPEVFLTPQPFNLWMNVDFSSASATMDSWRPPAEGQASWLCSHLHTVDKPTFVITIA